MNRQAESKGARLDALLLELCPNGVEYKSFLEIGDYIRGLSYGKDDETTADIKNAIPVIRANNITLESNMLNLDELKYVRASVKVKNSQYLKANDILICAGSGSTNHIGKVAFIENDLPCVFGAFMATIRVKNADDVLPRFLFHVFTSQRFRKYIREKIDSSTINNLNARVISQYKIPVPPLEVQEEIVRILDRWTELEAELVAELDARTTQYEYYRDSLLSPDGKPIVNACELISESFWLMPATPKYRETGIPYITSKNIINGHVDFTNVKYISEADYNHVSSNRSIQRDDLLITMIGTIGEAAFVEEDTMFYGQNIYLVRLDEERVNRKYFYYYLTSRSVKHELNSKKNPSNQGYIKAGAILNLKVPLPTIDEQCRVVSLLDRFDKLCFGISEGLPAEIEARRRQYKYYRDRLLTFEEMAS
ncbi:MAG: restriction endonuclease subunit S [Abditibacteriota bacterium]|nr:restriction endonuclease subunit S [Abditibacteriota bacterium]